MAATEKISISITLPELEWARERAEAEQTSLSAVVSEAVRRQRQRDARMDLLRELDVPELTDKERAALHRQWKG